MLDRLGCDTTLTENGELAFTSFSEHRPDVLLTDIEMPKLDGYGLATKIREFELDHSGPQLPIIALSAHTFAEHQDKAMLYGIDGYVPKPITLTELKKGILEVIEATDETTA